ncbi:MAG: N-acetylmuramoyl-L-alanine amidase [Fimbriimonadaceae bacterium]|nr:N-acetylmuramoyl-L-alanine amidase [Fimbriimonadaceae bacterium]
MKRFLLAVLPWMVIAVASAQEMPRPAQVFFTHYGKLAAPAYQIGTECFVPIDAVEVWGWKVKVDDRQAEITTADKKINVPYRTQSGKKVIPLSAIVNKLGGEAGWMEGTGQFYVVSPIKSIKFVDGKLDIESTMKIQPKVMYLEGPDRLVIDLIGAKLQDKTEIKISDDSRVGQFKPDTVRFVIETSDKPINPNLDIDPGKSYAIDLSASKRNPGSGGDNLNTPITIIPVTQDPPPTTGQNNPPTTGQAPPTILDPTKTAPANPGQPSVVAGPVRLLSEKPTLVQLAITLSATLPKPAMFKRVDPDTLEIYLPGTRHSAEDAPTFESQLLAGVEIEQNEGVAVLRLKLAKPMGIELINTGTEIQIGLTRPAVGDGSLAGKVIVVDPGHGGHDSGARSPAKEINEEDVNLRVGKELAKQLTAQGATVILTRKTDVFIELKERSEIANRNGADLFISVHTNSNKKANSTSGSIVFYHMSSPLGTLLADCINGEMAKAKTGIPTIGTWSDSRIYNSGFAVLRYSKMPSVLLELGFINHAKDRAKLKTDEYPILVSQAIVKGIKVYFGDEKED